MTRCTYAPKSAATSSTGNPGVHPSSRNAIAASRNDARTRLAGVINDGIGQAFQPGVEADQLGPSRGCAVGSRPLADVVPHVRQDDERPDDHIYCHDERGQQQPPTCPAPADQLAGGGARRRRSRSTPAATTTVVT